MHLQFTGALHGREEEIQRIQALKEKAALDVVSNVRSLARSLLWSTQQSASVTVPVGFVHGPSGSGKTALCETLKDDTVVFCSGKYDQFQNQPASAALIQALDTLGEQLESTSVLKECLENEAAILKKVVPSFSKRLLQQETQQEQALELEADKDTSVSNDCNNLEMTQSSKETLMQASERLSVGLRSFLRQLCQHPTTTTTNKVYVFFIDDLQFANKHSLPLLALILNDLHLQHCLFLFGYRDEEASSVDTLLSSIHTEFEDIQLHNLDLDATNNFVLQILNRTDLRETLPLAQLVKKRTDGNPFFIQQLFQTMLSQNKFVYNYAKAKWEWSLGELEKTSCASENVVSMVMQRVQMLPPDTLLLLQLGSCLGYQFDLELLCSLSMVEIQSYLEESGAENSSKSASQNKKGHGVDANDSTLILQPAVEEGFLEILNQSQYCFTHDRIHQSVYELLPSTGKQLSELHWKLGKQIQSHFKVAPEQRFLLSAVRQLNRGFGTGRSKEERLDLIAWNLEAAKAAKSQAGSQITASFLDKATEISHNDDWSSSCNLMLKVHSFAAEVHFASGDIQKSEQVVCRVLEKAQSQSDTVRCCFVQMDILGSRCDFAGAIACCQEILKLYGEKLPEPTALSFQIEVLKAKGEVQRKSNEFFLELEEMPEDSKYQTVMKALTAASTFAWPIDANLSYVCFVRMVRIMASRGFCDQSPYALGVYASVLAKHD